MSLPKHDFHTNQVYYEDGRAWTPERVGPYGRFVWKRVPEKDAHPDKS